MTTINLYGGPLKRDIIKRAYGYCGQSSAEFELSPEEFVAGLQAMNDQMALLGDATGYNFPINGDGSAEDESGLALSDVLGASVYVAQLLAPQIGKQLQVNGAQARAASAFLAKCATTPAMEFARNTPRGAGSRYSGGRPYYVTDISSDETFQ